MFLKTLPPAAGTPLVVFGSQASTDHARSQDAPFVVYSLEECFDEEDGEEEELKGPLILLGASAEQATACQRLINTLWSGRLVLLANAGVYQSFSRCCLLGCKASARCAAAGCGCSAARLWHIPQQHCNIWQFLCIPKSLYS